MKLILKFILLFLAAIIIYFLYLLAPTSFSDDLPAGEAGKVRFVVPMDTKQEDIVAMLRADNFIRSGQVFNFLAGLIRFPGAVEPGAYLLSHRMTAWQIADTLLLHPYQKWTVLVPGLRAEQTAEKLARKFNWDQAKTQEFLSNAREGYLFPDTYLLNVDYTGKQFAQRLMSSFDEKLDAKMQKDLSTQNEKISTAVKVASLIERESGSDDDKALIAGIIWNRLNDNMPLQIDAAIQYIIGTPADWWPRVTPKDLKIDSAYNTYLNRGLPPGPISSPSLASIKAAVYPAETDCLFYLHDRAKNIHCSKTYREHLQNIEDYLN